MVPVSDYQEILNFACRAFTAHPGLETLLRVQSAIQLSDQIPFPAEGVVNFARRALTTSFGFETLQRVQSAIPFSNRILIPAKEYSTLLVDFYR